MHLKLHFSTLVALILATKSSPVPQTNITSGDFRSEVKTCKAEVLHKMTHGRNLTLPHNKDDIDCIFAAGLTPSKVPLGLLYGKILSYGNSNSVDIPLDYVFNTKWWGTIVAPMYCTKENPTRGGFIGLKIFPSGEEISFVASVGPVNIPLVSGDEHNDGKDSFILDYTQDVSKMCTQKELDELAQRVNNATAGDSDRRRAISPTKLSPGIVDVARFVGRQEDGGAIYLGKAYLRGSDGLYRVIGSFSIVNYDLDVNAGCGWPNCGPNSLPPLPLEKDFESGQHSTF